MRTRRRWKRIAGWLLVAGGVVGLLLTGEWIFAAWGAAIGVGLLWTDMAATDPERAASRFGEATKYLWYALIVIAVMMLMSSPSLMSRRALR